MPTFGIYIKGMIIYIILQFQATVLDKKKLIRVIPNLRNLKMSSRVKLQLAFHLLAFGISKSIRRGKSNFFSFFTMCDVLHRNYDS